MNMKNVKIFNSVKAQETIENLKIKQYAIREDITEIITNLKYN
jgi:hypothetical protein